MITLAKRHNITAITLLRYLGVFITNDLKREKHISNYGQSHVVYHLWDKYPQQLCLGSQLYKLVLCLQCTRHSYTNV